MPHTRSAKKNMRKNEARKLRNRTTKKIIKTQLKKFTDVAASGTPEQLRDEYNATVKKLDKAAAKRIVHPNAAARKKSQLAKALQKKTAAPK
jgi:small subunit ribosomal protein S20